MKKSQTKQAELRDKAANCEGFRLKSNHIVDKPLLFMEGRKGNEIMK